MQYILETIAFNIDSCIKAQNAGVHRIELCDNPGEGGTTASYGFIKAAREQLQIDLYPIIRPRGGDFLYSSYDFEIIKADIKVCKELGCNGVVIGMLTENANIDKIRCSILVNIAYPMSVTFHRAFDRVAQPEKALEDVIEIGCERILTSGFYPTALEGASNLKTLITQANNRIIIMPGSGVRASNIATIAVNTGAVEFHSSARNIQSTNMKFTAPFMNENLQTVSTDTEEIQNMLLALQNI
ncbi:MAG: copper homeostasis protein CutC [Ferruginibacter sp.]|nr:copper homeostasis protein CutC [Ferruginibacter sp.]